MVVSARVNEGTEYSDLIVSQMIRNNFVASFNADSTSVGKLVYEYPIVALGVLRFALKGPTRDMDDTEMGYFAAFAERRVVEPIFEALANDEYSLRSVDWKDEYHFSVARDDVAVGEVGSATGEVVDQSEVLVQLFVLVTCRNELLCTSANFQDHVEKAAVPNAESLTTALADAGAEVPYFSEIKAVQFLSRDNNETSEQIDENVSPSGPNNNGGQKANTTKARQQIPLWVWMLVIVDFAVLVGVFGYVSHRRNKRQAQGGEKTQDSPEQQQQTRRMSMQVTPFNIRPKQGQQVAKTAQQIEEDEYDAHSYDFSVEAGELAGDDDSEVDLSTFRRPRTRRHGNNR
jgi:hypothetical protein